MLCDITILDSTLNNKTNSICFHLIREGAAMYEWQTVYANTHLNETYLLTKLLPSRDKRRDFVRNLIHHIFALSEV